MVIKQEIRKYEGQILTVFSGCLLDTRIQLITIHHTHGRALTEALTEALAVPNKTGLFCLTFKTALPFKNRSQTKPGA